MCDDIDKITGVDTSKPNVRIVQNIGPVVEDKRSTQHIGIDDNFFDVGGHSIKLMELNIKLQQIFDTKIDIVDLLPCFFS